MAQKDNGAASEWSCCELHLIFIPKYMETYTKCMVSIKMNKRNRLNSISWITLEITAPLGARNQFEWAHLSFTGSGHDCVCQNNFRVPTFLSCKLIKDRLICRWISRHWFNQWMDKKVDGFHWFWIETFRYSLKRNISYVRDFRATKHSKHERTTIITNRELKLILKRRNGLA